MVAGTSLYKVITKSLCTWLNCIRTIPTQLMISRWPSQNAFGMWTVLYRTRSSKTVRRVNKCLETGGEHFEHYLLLSVLQSSGAQRPYHPVFYSYENHIFTATAWFLIWFNMFFLSQMEEQQPTPPRALLPDVQQLLLQQQQLEPHEFSQQILQSLERYQIEEHRLQQRLQSVRQKILILQQILAALPPGNDFISLMAGTLTVHHCPMRPIKVKRYNYSIDTKNLQNKYESPSDKE